MSDARYVFDTNTLVIALLLAGSRPSQALRLALRTGRVLLSPATAEELVEVLQREKFERYVTPLERKEFPVALLERALLVEPTEGQNGVCPPVSLRRLVNGVANMLSRLDTSTRCLWLTAFLLAGGCEPQQNLDLSSQINPTYPGARVRVWQTLKVKVHSGHQSYVSISKIFHNYGYKEIRLQDTRVVKSPSFAKASVIGLEFETEQGGPPNFFYVRYLLDIAVSNRASAGDEGEIKLEFYYPYFQFPIGGKATVVADVPCRALIDYVRRVAEVSIPIRVSSREDAYAVAKGRRMRWQIAEWIMIGALVACILACTLYWEYCHTEDREDS